jgi:H/ACA ribonucleoprotein complex subunit 3
MKSDIRMCSRWRAEHDRPVYSLSSTCPECGGDTENSAPAPFDPDDPYGEYRRRLKRKRRRGDDAD